MNKKAKALNIWACGVAVNHLYKAIDEITLNTLGYNATDHHIIMEKAMNLSLMHKETPDNVEIKKELDKLLESYKKEYGWMYEDDRGDGE